MCFISFLRSNFHKYLNNYWIIQYNEYSGGNKNVYLPKFNFRTYWNISKKWLIPSVVLYQSILNFNLSALYLFTHIYFVSGSTNYYGQQLPMSNFFFSKPYPINIINWITIQYIILFTYTLVLIEKVIIITVYDRIVDHLRFL